MVQRVQPGVYAIRNLRDNLYLNPDGGYTTAGRNVMLNIWVQQGSLKWTLIYNPMGGTYWIRNFVSNHYLAPGIPSSRGQPPRLELSDMPFEWVIADTPNGNGFFIVKANEQDQVVEADIGGPGALLNDLDPSRTEQRQIWAFELTQ